MSGDPDEIVLADHHSELVEAARAVLATSKLPPVVLIGGLAVAMRVGTVGQPHRATVDIDLVTTAADPATVEILADTHGSARQPLVIAGVKVDLIETTEASAADLADLEATIACSSPGIGGPSRPESAPSTRRRSTKMPSDLLDLYRLVERYDRRGAVSQEIRSVPGEIAAVIASVVEREILANPAAATNKMRSASLSPIDNVEVGEVMGDLRRGPSRALIRRLGSPDCPPDRRYDPARGITRHHRSPPTPGLTRTFAHEPIRAGRPSRDS